MSIIKRKKNLAKVAVKVLKKLKINYTYDLTITNLEGINVII